jgi:hypothetical protein
MMLEDRQKGGIAGNVLVQYLKMNGGILFFGFISFVTACQVGSQITANIWLAHWTDESTNNPGLNNMYYLGIYSSFSLSYGILAFVRSYLLAYTCTKSANQIHAKMVK